MKEELCCDFEEALAKEWKGYVDRGAEIVDALEDNTQELAFAKGFYRGWNYPKQLSVNKDFEKTFISMVQATHENGGNYSLHEYAQRLYNIARDTLREPVSESLEKVAIEYGTHYDKNWSDVKDGYIAENEVEAFKAGAMWQKQQILDNNALLYNARMEGIEIGKAEMKQQIEKNSVECTVRVDAGGYPYIGNIELYDYENDKPLAKAGDKVKVIINN